MKKLIISCIVMFLLVAVGAYAALTGTALNTPAGNLGQTVTVNFNLINTETYNITNVNFTASNLVGPSGYTINAPLISDFTSTIIVDSTVSSSFNVIIPSGSNAILAGTYDGNVSLTGSDGTSNITSLFLYSMVVNPVGGLSVDTYSTSSPLVLTAQEGESNSNTAVIRNTGSTQLNSISITHNVDTGDDDGDNLTLSIVPQTFSLSPGGSSTITFTATMGDNLDVGTYSGNVFINDTSGIGKIFSLDAKVTPEVCEGGPIGELKVDVEEPDDNDNFDFGETINVDVSVLNKHDKDLDVIIEAFLYNIDEDEELVRVELDAGEIKDGDEEDFTLDLEIPADNDFSEDDEFVLYVKAYEDGDEDDNCDQEDVVIDLDRKSHDVIVTDVALNPSSVSCGETISIAVDVANVGTKDEDGVTVKVFHSALGLDETSSKYDLENFDDSDNDATAKFAYTIPTTVNPGTFSIESLVTFNNGKDSNSGFGTLTVTSCNGEVLTATAVSTATSGVSADLNLASSTQGTISGSEGGRTTFTVDGVNVHTITFDIVATSSATITVASTPASFTLTIGASRSVDLNSDGRDDIRVTLSKIVGGVATVSVEKISTGVTSSLSTTTGFVPINLWNQLGSNLSKPSTVFWIVADLLLIIVLIFLIKMLFTRRT